jgi:predicted RNA binding protein YcfA (HicA-like mRNA interferase family)
MVERDGRRIVKRLMAEGWVRKGMRGPHHEFVRGAEVPIVPHPKEDLPRGTVRAIVRAAGWL